MKDKGHIAMVHKQAGMEGLTPSYTIIIIIVIKKWYRETNVTPWPVLSEVSPLESVPPAWWHPGSPPPGSRDGPVQTSTDFIWCYVAVAAASAVCSEQFKTASWAPEKGTDVYYNTISDIFKR